MWFIWWQCDEAKDSKKYISKNKPNLEVKMLYVLHKPIGGSGTGSDFLSQIWIQQNNLDPAGSGSATIFFLTISLNIWASQTNRRNLLKENLIQVYQAYKKRKIYVRRTQKIKLWFVCMSYLFYYLVESSNQLFDRARQGPGGCSLGQSSAREAPASRSDAILIL